MQVPRSYLADVIRDDLLRVAHDEAAMRGEGCTAVAATLFTTVMLSDGTRGIHDAYRRNEACAMSEFITVPHLRRDIQMHISKLSSPQ